MGSVPDKSWMDIDNRFDPIYMEGVKKFIEFALVNVKNLTPGVIPCACKKCYNLCVYNHNIVFEHIVLNGFMSNYRIWSRHGENVVEHPSSSLNPEKRDDMTTMLLDAFGMHGMPNLSNFDGDVFQETSTPIEDPLPEEPALPEGSQKFFRLLNDANQPLYPGCEKFSKLSFIVRLYHLKVDSGWSNKSFNQLLGLLRDVLPGGNESIPKSIYESKKIIGELGLKYNKIDACRYDCMLFWKDSQEKEVCDRCGTSRWLTSKACIVGGRAPNKRRQKKIAAKVLWHFPLIPRLQRLFMSSKNADLMRWHHEDRIKDGLL